MANPTDPWGRRLGRALTRLVVFALVAALLAAVTFLLSQLNARRFRVKAVDGTLVVMKGRHLPLGSSPYRPTDSRLREAYAPLPLHGAELGLFAERTFEDRDELDRTLFGLLHALAEPRLHGASADQIQEGLYYVERASHLQGVSPEQRQALVRMQTEVAFYKGRSLLAEAERRTQQGLEQLRAAASTENPHTREAQQMMLAIEEPARVLDEALRRAVNLLSAPPPVTSQGGGPAPAPKAVAGTPDAGS